MISPVRDRAAEATGRTHTTLHLKLPEKGVVKPLRRSYLDERRLRAVLREQSGRGSCSRAHVGGQCGTLPRPLRREEVAVVR